jgi:hypothetical protein
MFLIILLAAKLKEKQLDFSGFFLKKYIFSVISISHENNHKYEETLSTDGVF